MGKGKRAEGEVGNDRLDILEYAAACGRIPVVADRDMAGKFLKPFLAEDVGNKAHCLFKIELPAVRRTDARALLPPVLERVEPKVSKVCCFGMAKNAEDTAFFANLSNGSE